ncbi:MAG: hypothetical protein FWG74_07395 [Planctomycetes bacterium]|nr:hypothetical protein [Planctomycetota bacterium]
MRIIKASALSTAPALPLFLLSGPAFSVEQYWGRDFSQGNWGAFFFELFRSLDIVGFSMLILLVVLICLSLDLLNHLRIGRLIPELLLSEVQEIMANGEYEKALEACEKSECLIGQVFAAALMRTDNSFQRMEEAMRGEVRIQGLIWRQWVGQFRTTGIGGFLLGLMGATLDGMRLLAEFDGRPNLGLAFASSFEIRAIGHNILLSLFLGALMAAISLFAHRYCAGKLEKILLEAERLGEDLLDPFRPLPQEE